MKRASSQNFLPLKYIYAHVLGSVKLPNHEGTPIKAVIFISL